MNGARGLTIVECVVSMLVVSLMLGAALRVATSARQTIASADRQATAWWLAERLAAEVLERRYAETPGATVGIDAGENSADKGTFDDVDDFHGWSESPPTGSGNAALGGLNRWTRAVQVSLVEPEAPATPSASDLGVKRIVVVARFEKTELARLVVLKADVPEAP